MKRPINLMKQYNKLFKKILFCFIAAVLFAIGGFIAVKAASYTGTVYDRTTWHGYFLNGEDRYGNPSTSSVLPRIADWGNKAINSQVDSVQELVDFLRSYNNSTDDHKKVGSAFIVYTMLGGKRGLPTGFVYNESTWPGNYLKVSDADWTELLQRLNYKANKNQILWNTTATTNATNVNSYYQWGGNTGTNYKDVAFYRDDKAVNVISILNDDGSSYRLMRDCANPIGVIGKSEVKVPKWSVSVSNTVSMLGNKITWTHTVKNSSLYGTDRAIQYYYQTKGAATPLNLSTGAIYGGSVSQSNSFTAGQSRNFLSTYDVQSGDNGKEFCRNTIAYPPAWNNLTGSVESTKSCVKILNTYELIPSVELDVSGIVEPGSSYNVKYSVNNNSANNSAMTFYNLNKIVSQPGYAVSTTSKSSGSRIFNGGDYDFLPITETALDNYLIGTSICYTLSVTPHSSQDPNINTSQPVCVKIGKKPKVQIWGGDLMSGGKIQTSTSVKIPHTYGSWIEYGAFAFGNIKGFASGAAYRNPGIYATNGNDFCTTGSRLSFANVDCASGLVGNYLSEGYSPQNIEASFPGGTIYAGSTFIPSDNTGVFKTGDIDVTLSSARFLGQTTVIKSSGTVTISGNQLEYNPLYEYKTLSEIPQLIIIANNIIIKSNVTRVDAWLIARSSEGNGTIQTCETEAKDTNTCKDQLIVNGPVVTDRLLLYRTAGSGTGVDNSGTPAEIFNLRADAYLWAAARARENNSVKTVYTTELPPRF
jgi:hypothetical protein